MSWCSPALSSLVNRADLNLPKLQGFGARVGSVKDGDGGQHVIGRLVCSPRDPRPAHQSNPKQDSLQELAMCQNSPEIVSIDIRIGSLTAYGRLGESIQLRGCIQLKVVYLLLLHFLSHSNTTYQ